MAGIANIKELLDSMNPVLMKTEFVFCTVEGILEDYLGLHPIATFIEPEGLTLILEKPTAEAAALSFEGTYRQITLKVHSSLEAVGLTAAVSTRLASIDISANMVAAYYHDHIFVPSSKADDALSVLKELNGQ
ncbi:ACT domain-containing protein [Porticoccus sp. GXU_MW_L64]